MPAIRADPECTMYVIHKAAVAVTATSKLNALPTPTKIVVACHHGLGISLNLKIDNYIPALRTSILFR